MNFILDNIDTRAALEYIRDLIGLSNIYLRDLHSNGKEGNCVLMCDIASYITQIIRVFGAIPSNDVVGFPSSSQAGSNVSSCVCMYIYIKNFWLSGCHIG